MKYLILLLFIIGCAKTPINTVTQTDLEMRVMEYCQSSSMDKYGSHYSDAYQKCMHQWGYDQ
jgi:hypothetical protein